MQATGVRVAASKKTTCPEATIRKDGVRVAVVEVEHVGAHRRGPGLGQAEGRDAGGQVDHLGRGPLAAVLEVAAVVDVELARVAGLVDGPDLVRGRAGFERGRVEERADGARAERDCEREGGDERGDDPSLHGRFLLSIEGAARSSRADELASRS